MKIGLPKGLLFYYYYPLWRPLFEGLGMEVAVSRPTNARLIDSGVKVSVPEICVPIKAFSGHVIDLLKQGVDYCFIPRMVTIDRGNTFCPKFLGLPEMMEYTIPGLKGKLLSPVIKTNGEDMARLKGYKTIWEALGVSKRSFKSALKEANMVWQSFRSYCRAGYRLDQATELALGTKKESDFGKDAEYDVNIGVIGYVYNIYDSYISMDIINKLDTLGAGVRTFEMVDEDYINRKLDSLSKSLFWTFTNKLWGAADKYYKDDRIDGLIHVTAFNCGPDSMLGKVLELDSDKYGKPFMTIRVDEHTGGNHLETRIEAFVDMIRRKKTIFKGVDSL
jgi:predicted nucleotide-binding protein (sugar kinase/HSP70/actin superfamily)